MARIRTIKPEFFKHLKLFELEEETGLPLRVAFSGLWTVCDRDGRFEWIPRQIKVDVLPYDDVDFSRVLDALATRDFVRKYEENGVEYGYVPGFTEHQVINNKERQSNLPKPKENNILTRDDNASSTREPRVTQGKEGKGRERKEDKKKPSVSKKRKSSLPEQCPTIEDQEKAINYWKQHATPATLSTQVDKFRAHHEREGSTFVDWSAAWRTWYTSARDFAERASKVGQPKGSPVEHWSQTPLLDASQPQEPTVSDWIRGEEHFYNFGGWPDDLKDHLDKCPTDILNRVQGKDAA